MEMLLLLLFLLTTLATRITAFPFLPLSTQTLHIRYQNTPWINSPGTTLTIDETTTAPYLSIQALNPTKTHLILLIDVDVIHSPNATNILHWYQSNLVPNTLTNNKTLIPGPSSKTNPRAAYIGPQPPKGQKHRYVFLLFEQNADYVFPECFRGFLSETVEARSGFDIRQFVDVARLESPIAVNFVWVGDGDVNATGTVVVASRTSLASAPCGISTGPGYKKGVWSPRFWAGGVVDRVWDGL